jgi:7,8-dihydropterin-6-yl-methyl-4-(beta-D-ribofuranosyl)aminobenzene 5'-phosphate synthase
VIHNAKAMGVDLNKVDKIVLSHGHFDHTGGLENVLRQMNKTVEIITHPETLTAKFQGNQKGSKKSIGLPFQLPELKALGAKFKLSKKPVKITPDIMTTGEVPMLVAFEEITPDRFFIKEDSQRWHPDEFNDDLALIINTRPGLIVILGCAHRGMINTLYHAQKLTGRKEIRLVIGGSHLLNSSRERVYKTIAALKELDVQKVGVSHCTGQEASAIMAQELGDRFFYNNACTGIDITDKEIKVD